MENSSSGSSSSGSDSGTKNDRPENWIQESFIGQWHIGEGATRKGPFSWEKIREMLDRGEIGPEAHLYHSDHPQYPVTPKEILDWVSSDPESKLLEVLQVAQKRQSTTPKPHSPPHGHGEPPVQVSSVPQSNFLIWIIVALSLLLILMTLFVFLPHLQNKPAEERPATAPRIETHTEQTPEPQRPKSKEQVSQPVAPQVVTPPTAPAAVQPPVPAATTAPTEPIAPSNAMANPLAPPPPKRPPPMAPKYPDPDAFLQGDETIHLDSASDGGESQNAAPAPGVDSDPDPSAAGSQLEY